MRTRKFPFWLAFLPIAVISILFQASRCEGSLASRLTGQAVFPDPLTFVSAAPPSDNETQPLWDIVEWLASQPTVKAQLDAFEGFISTHPDSPWTPSLRANLASFYRKQGRFSLALGHWEGAWFSVRGQETPGAKSVGDYVLGNWTELLASLGQAERLGQVLAATEGRTLDGGPWQQRYNASKEAWRRMLGEPRMSYRCGIIALSAVGEALSSNAPALPGLKGEPATEQGLSFADLSRLAQRYQLPLVAVELPTDVTAQVDLAP